MGGGSGKQVGCPGCWSGLASHHPPGPCAVSLGSPGAICAEVVLRHSLGRRFRGPEEPLSESDAGSSGLSSTVRTDGGKGQAYQSLWRLPGSGWGRAGPRAPMGRSALRCAEQDMGWSRAWLAGESRERWGTLMQQVDECWYVGVTPGREDVRLVEEEGAWVVCPAGPEAVQVCPCAG